MALVECIPNVSEARPPRVAALADRVRQTTGVRLLDVSSDVAHNRCVLTFAGAPAAVRDAVLSLVAGATAEIDLRTHRGEHPRVGAVDVVPFVPLAGSTMAACVQLARETGFEMAARFGIPVYLYEEAASHPHRRRLEDIRRGGLEGLTARMALPEWAPDFGPAQPHATAGVSVVGARRPLVAYNVNLSSADLDAARRIAATVRERNGGLPGLKALGLRLHDRGIVQVSMNLTDLERTSLRDAFEAVTREATRLGVAVLESEIIGLVPASAFEGTTPQDLQLRDFTPDRILETRLAARP